MNYHVIYFFNMFKLSYLIINFILKFLKIFMPYFNLSLVKYKSLYYSFQYSNQFDLKYLII